MQIELYNFAKKSNSTAQPDIVNATTLECQLKDRTSLLKPIITIRPNLIQGFSPAAFNYAHIAYWQRYYFITDWQYDNAIWECHLSCDILASFKTPIGNMSEYILRSSYEKDGRVIDPVYGVKTVSDTQLTTLDPLYISTYTAGFFVVGIIGSSINATMGSITYYQMSAESLAQLLNYLLTDDFFTHEMSGLEITTNLAKLIYSPVQYIVSCVWYPFQMSAIDSNFKYETVTINFGWWGVAISTAVYRLLRNVPVMTKNFELNVPKHPQQSRGEYLNHAPFTTHVLKIPPFEDIVISDQYLTGTDTIKGVLNVDPISGVGVLSVYSWNGSRYTTLLSRVSQKIGVDIQLSQIGVDYYGGLSTLYKGTVNMTTQYAGAVGGALSSLVSLNVGGAASAGTALGTYLGTEDMMVEALRADVIKQTAPQVLSSGHNGSMVDYKQTAYMCSTFNLVTDNDNTRLGSPLCKIRTIKNIPGFIVVMNPEVNISCTDPERTAIVNYMSAGFFYE